MNSILYIPWNPNPEFIRFPFPLYYTILAFFVIYCFSYFSMKRKVKKYSINNFEIKKHKEEIRELNETINSITYRYFKWIVIIFLTLRLVFCVKYNVPITQYLFPKLEFTIMPIRYYGLLWLVGIFLSVTCVQYLYKKTFKNLNHFDDLFLYCFLGILLGARVGHCIFYEPQRYLSSISNFVEIIMPFNHDGQFIGFMGLASHGGTIGLMLAIYLFCKNNHIRFFSILDMIAIATPICATCIRIANLVNSEIIGKITDVPWAFIFEKVDAMPRHPGQLYEAIAYALLFFIMWAIYKRSSQHPSPNTHHPQVGTGWYFGFCLTYIFTFRFFIEYTKEIQEAFEASLPLDMGQILSIPFIIIGVVCMLRAKNDIK